jgi:hypothetical protein
MRSGIKQTTLIFQSAVHNTSASSDGGIFVLDYIYAYNSGIPVIIGSIVLWEWKL